MGALLRLRLQYSDINDKENTILKYAGVRDLFERIEKVVLQNRRDYIVAEINKDYVQCMKVIYENAASHLDDSKSYLKKLTEDREFDQSQIEEIEQNNKDIEILQRKVREIRRNLEIEIGINIDKKQEV